MLHELKTWPEYFQPIINKEKMFDVRNNDRNFQIGDILRLREFRPHETIENGIRKNHGYTGREIRVRILYVLALDNPISAGEMAFNDPVILSIGHLTGHEMNEKPAIVPDHEEYHF